MFKSILGLSAVLGLVATTAVVGCSGNATSEDSESGGSAVISGKQFTADCTLSATKDGKTINGYLEGQFKVGTGNALTASKPIYVSIGTRGSNDYKLVVKSGTLTDAQNEIFEFTANQNVFGHTFDSMDISIKYDGVKKTANVDSVLTGKDAYTASCKFTDENGKDTTNFVQTAKN